jgi:hypothetical protein
MLEMGLLSASPGSKEAARQSFRIPAGLCRTRRLHRQSGAPASSSVRLQVLGPDDVRHNAGAPRRAAIALSTGSSAPDFFCPTAAGLIADLSSGPSWRRGAMAVTKEDAGAAFVPPVSAGHVRRLYTACSLYRTLGQRPPLIRAIRLILPYPAPQ